MFFKILLVGSIKFVKDSNRGDCNQNQDIEVSKVPKFRNSLWISSITNTLTLGNNSTADPRNSQKFENLNFNIFKTLNYAVILTEISKIIAILLYHP